MNILTAMFCLGVYTLLAQMLVTRELSVLCLGNELTIGIVFSVWLVLAGAGARLYRRGSRERVTSNVSVFFLWLAVALPVVILALRAGVGWIRPAGEYPDLLHVFGAAFLALAPICIPAGMIFPRGCEVFSLRGAGRGISGVYAIEALGSFIGGAVFSFFLIGRFVPFQNVLLAVFVCLTGVVCVAEGRRPMKLLAVLLLLLLAVAGFRSSLALGLEQRSVAWRWAALGVTCEAKAGQPAVVLKDGADSRYQNLALVESQGLFTLYGDGQVMFSFPDEITGERAVNFIMAQKPDARRILLLGGNPAGELPWLLRYPVQEVVHVERDSAIDTLVRRGAPGINDLFEHDPRLTRVYEDGPRYVKRCKTLFDVVLIHSPEPVTGGLNRFYTREFYEDVQAILAPDGFMHTSVEASERLEKDASRMAGSIYQTLASVFPVVKPTAGSPLQFFASGPDGRLSDDREELYRRSSESAKVSRNSFQPIYLLNADEWEPGKVDLTRQRLTMADAPINTIRRPVSCYYTLILWSRYSGSVLGSGLRWLEQIKPWTLAAAIASLGGLCMLAGAMIRRRHPSGMVRIAVGTAMAVTGFCGVALEMILLYAFQGLYGYVYSRMGFMVGLFMLGTVLGAWQIRRIEIEQWSFPAVRRTVAAGLMIMIALSLAVWATLMNAAPAEWMLYGLTLAAGGVVGMQFIAVTRLFVAAGVPPGEAASWTWLADYAGSAFGGLAAGVFLVALLGVAATCLVLCAGLGISLVFFAVFSSGLPIPIRRE